jgi:Mn-containing catalase
MNDGTELVTMKEPRESYPIPLMPERPEEFAPGLDPELQELADALDNFKQNLMASKSTSVSSKKSSKK